MDDANVDCVVCLGCGGAVLEPGQRLPGGVNACSCPPTETEAQEAGTVECSSCGGSLKVGVRACPYCHCTLATQRCGQCFAWNLASARHCQQCGQGLEELGSASGRAAGGKCPRCCTTSLAARVYAELDVDECDKCGGLFIEEAMLNRLIDTRENARNALHLALPKRDRRREPEVRYLQCPACEKHMNRQVFGKVSGVIVDTCKLHGIWFDPGELGDVIEFVEKGGMSRARERETEELREATRQLRAAQQPVSMPGHSMGGPMGSMGGWDSGTSFAAILADFWSGL